MITEELSNKYYGYSLKIFFVLFTAHSLINSNLGTIKGPPPSLIQNQWQSKIEDHLMIENHHLIEKIDKHWA